MVSSGVLARGREGVRDADVPPSRPADRARDRFRDAVRGRRLDLDGAGAPAPLLSDFTSGQLVDTLAADITERWELHRAAIAAEEGRRAREAALADLCEFHSARDEEEIRLAVARGDAIPTADPSRFRFTHGGARAFIRRFDDGDRRVTAAGIGDPDLRNVPIEEQERHYRTAARIQELTRGRTWSIFGLSAIAFVASMLLWTSWSWLAWLVPVLLFHEFGHWAAMRLLGHRDAWIAFIPFFGAATISGKRFDKISHEIIVLLAGPVPGIVLGTALIFLSAVSGVRSSFLVRLAALLLGINILNLLPLHPLDGGRIVHALVTAGRPRVSLVLKALAAVAFVAAAIKLRDPTMALLAAVSGLALRHEIKRSRIEGEIRRTPGFADTNTAEARRPFIFETLKGKPEGAPAHWLASVRLLEVPLSHTKPGRFSALMAGLAYVGFFGASLFGVARIGSSTMKGMHCPNPSGAIALSCDAPTLPANAWSNLPRPARARPSGPTSEGATFGVAAFVWCELPDQATATDLARRLSEAAHNGARYCTALPWEKTGDGVAEAGHLRARSTLAELRRATFESDENEATAVDAVIARAQGRTDFDPEVARMYRAGVADPRRMTEEARQALGDRLGRSATRSCDQLALANVVGTGRLSGEIDRTRARTCGAAGKIIQRPALRPSRQAGRLRSAGTVPVPARLSGAGPADRRRRSPGAVLLLNGATALDQHLAAMVRDVLRTGGVSSSTRSTRTTGRCGRSGRARRWSGARCGRRSAAR